MAVDDTMKDRPTGEYFRPSDDQVSGIPGTTAEYRRTPCPALNSLANHGHLPRDGKGVSKAAVKDAVINVFGIEEGFADTLVEKLPETPFDLDLLGKHKFIEHDASLVHDDSYLGKDPCQVNAALVSDLLSHAKDGKIGAHEIIQFKKTRERDCKATNPEYSFTPQERLVAFGETSLTLIAFGDKKTETISAEDAESFFLHERIPEDYKKAEEPIGLPYLLLAKLFALWALPWTTKK